MRYPVANLRRPFLGVVSGDPCAGVTGLLARYNCQNDALKASLAELGPKPPPFAPPPPPPPPPAPFRPGPGNLPMSVATGGIPSAPPPEMPEISPEPPPPPPGPPRPDVASVDRYIPREPEPPPPEPVEPMPTPPMSVATGVPTSQPPLPPPPVPSEVPKCYVCGGGKAALLLPSQAGTNCTEVPEVNCRPEVPSIDRYIRAGIDPLSMIPGGIDASAVQMTSFGGLDAGATAASGMSLLGRHLYRVTNLR